jgi:hypothetical protein
VTAAARDDAARPMRRPARRGAAGGGGARGGHARARRARRDGRRSEEAQRCRLGTSEVAAPPARQARGNGQDG